MPSQSTMDFYWKLASDDKDERVAAAAGLLTALRDADSQDDWDYALKRLVRGLSSSRGSSRLGFYMALAELLGERRKHISVDQYLDLATESFKVPNNATGPEERGLSFGALFALQALIRSPILVEDTTTLLNYSRWLAMLLDLADRKTLLRESCFFTLCEAIQRLASENMPFDAEAAVAETLRKVDAKNYTVSSEGVALYLTVPVELRARYGSDLPKGWKNGDPLARGNLALLSKALREIPVHDDQKQKGSWKPSLHFVWTKLLEVLQDDTSSDGEQDVGPPKKKHKSKKDKKDKKKMEKKGGPDVQQDRVGLADIWRVVVEEGMFSGSASQERKYWGFEIFSLLMRQTADIEALFTANFARTLAGQLAAPDKTLNKQAKRVLSLVEEQVQARPELALRVIKAILAHVPHFDRVSKTKFVDKMLPVVPVASLNGLVDVIFGIFAEPGELEPKAVDMRRQWAIDSLVHLVKSRAKHEDAAATKWIDSIIDGLVQYGYFADSDPADAKLSDHSVNVCQTRLNSIMTATIGRKRADGKSWAFYTFDKLHAYEDAGRPLRAPFEGDLERAKAKSVSTLYKIRNRRTASKHSDNGQLEAFELLFSLVLLQVYSVDSEAGSILEELQVVYNTLMGRAKVGETDDKSELDAGQVLTEILISFMSRKSALLRTISEEIFATFASQMTADSLQLLYDVLSTRESEAGQKDLFEGGDEDDEDVEDAEDIEMEDEEEDDEDEDDDDEEDEDDDEDDEDEDDDESSDVVEETEQKTKEALAKALGVAAGDEEDDESSDGDDNDNDDDDESMDDEQMMALDSQLAAIFSERRAALEGHKARSSKKKDIKDAKENVIQLKLRVVDLLDAYVKNEPSNPLVLTTILPLLSLLRFTKSKQLGEKAHALLKGRVCKIRTLPTLADNDAVVDLLEVLSAVHKEAQRSTNKSHSLAANQCSVFISKVLLHHSKGTAKDIAQIFAGTLASWIEKPSNKATPALFFDFVNFASAFRQKKDN